jgi:hypothetical protein
MEASGFRSLDGILEAVSVVFIRHWASVYMVQRWGRATRRGVADGRKDECVSRRD